MLWYDDDNLRYFVDVCRAHRLTPDTDTERRGGGVRVPGVKPSTTHNLSPVKRGPPRRLNVHTYCPTTRPTLRRVRWTTLLFPTPWCFLLQTTHRARLTKMTFLLGGKVAENPTSPLQAELWRRLEAADSNNNKTTEEETTWVITIFIQLLTCHILVWGGLFI